MKPNSKTHQRASNGVSTNARIDAQIEQAKARLSALYAKRRAIIAAKPSKRESVDERRKQVVAMAQAGASMEAIMAKMQLSNSTIRYYLWQAIAAELLETEPGTTYSEREFELKKQRYPGIKWHMGGGDGGRSYLPPWPLETHPADWRAMRIKFNDGTVDPPYEEKPLPPCCGPFWSEH